MKLTTSDIETQMLGHAAGAGVSLIFILIPFTPILAPILYIAAVPIIGGFALFADPSIQLHPAIVIGLVLIALYTIYRAIKWMIKITPPYIFIPAMAAWFAGCYGYQIYATTGNDIMWGLLAAALGFFVGRWTARQISFRAHY
jgi:hypothetical protein